MLDMRWMLILENRICIFGTPALAQIALRRHLQHALPDSILEERLSFLRPDVTSWNVVVASPTNPGNISFRAPHTAWAQLQQDADVLVVAARFGAKIRIDFCIHADNAHDRDFFTRKARFFVSALLGAPTAETTSPDALRRLQNFILDSNRVQGSVEMSSREFGAWCDNLLLARAGLTPAAHSGD